MIVEENNVLLEVDIDDYAQKLMRLWRSGVIESGIKVSR
jgi:hypothetical protein